MTYNEAIEKIDFLNKKFKKIRWYKLNITWEKINKWYEYLKGKNNETIH
ncbi:MAG: hypothetical protein ACFFHD_15265 [Promethearchaeota archaeon]